MGDWDQVRKWNQPRGPEPIDSPRWEVLEGLERELEHIYET